MNICIICTSIVSIVLIMSVLDCSVGGCAEICVVFYVSAMIFCLSYEKATSGVYVCVACQYYCLVDFMLSFPISISLSLYSAPTAFLNTFLLTPNVS